MRPMKGKEKNSKIKVSDFRKVGFRKQELTCKKIKNSRNLGIN